MANVKISQLPTAATLQATDAFPIVQGASTVKGLVSGFDTRNDGRYFRKGQAEAPGTELHYSQSSASIQSTATSVAGAVVVLAGASVTYDGSPVMVEFFCPYFYNAGLFQTYAELFDGSTAIGIIAGFFSAAASQSVSIHGARRITPTAGAHTFSIRMWVNGGTGTSYGGNAAAGTYPPMFLRITKV